MMAGAKHSIPYHMPVNILLVDDNEADIELTCLAFEEEGFPCHLIVTRNGGEAVEYLSKHDQFQNALTPDLILLDINMPGMDGKEFLETVKREERLKHIPVMILSSSNAPNDIHDCYHLYANDYMVKPACAAERGALVKRVSQFLNENLSESPS